MEKILAPMIECVSEKLIYQDSGDVSNKPAERLICQGWYAQVGQGISHSCTKLERQKNLTAIVKSTSPTTQGKVPSNFIKDLSTNYSRNTLALKTFGPKQLAASVGKTEVKKPFFSLDKLNKLQLKLHVTCQIKFCCLEILSKLFCYEFKANIFKNFILISK